jgi:hypothetical protein
MMDKELEYIPKGGMCKVCLFSNEDCSKMPFKDMQKLTKPDKDGLVIVKCSAFLRVMSRG